MEIKPLSKKGNFVEKQLQSIIVKKNGNPDRLAIDVYSHLKGWFQPNKDNNFKKTGKFDIRKYGYRTSYEELAKEHKCSKELVRQKIVLLEELGLVSRDFRIEYTGGIRKNNVLHLLVWKDTPHFCFEHGLEKRSVFNSNINKETWKKIEKESSILSKKLEVAPPTNEGGSLQQTLDIINSNTTLHTTPHIRIDNHDYQENQFLKISEFSEEEISQEKSVCLETPKSLGTKQFVETDVKRLAEESSGVEITHSDQATDIVQTEAKPKEQAVIHQFNPLKDRVSITDKNGNTYWGTPLVKLKYSKTMLEQIRLGSTKPHFTHERIIGLLNYIAEKYPDKLIIGGKAGFISYMTKVVNGEMEYTQEEKLESIEKKRIEEMKELEDMFNNGRIQWA